MTLIHTQIRRPNKEKKVLRQRLCKQCGTVFTPEYGDKSRTFCSKECSRKYSKRKRVKIMGGKSHRKRAKFFGVPYEPVKVYMVFARDGWTCQICGKKTPPKYRGTIRGDAPELDHRVPMSMGGGHTYDNVQRACRKCNIAKGNKSSAGQIPLFSDVGHILGGGCSLWVLPCIDQARA